MSNFAEEPNLQVDDDGFVLLITPDTYLSFIDEDWTLEQVTSRFTEQMNSGSMFAAYVGEGFVLDRLNYGPPDPAEAIAREAASVVDVGADGIWITDYTQITMAAQFADYSPLGEYSTRLPVDAGRYEVRLKQLDSGALHLDATIASATAHIENHAVPWFEL